MSLSLCGVQRWRGVVMLSDTAVSPQLCTAVFVRPTVVLTAGRCFTGSDPESPSSPETTGRDGRFAPSSGALVPRVWSGPSWVERSFVGTVTNYSFIYRPGFHGSNIGIGRVSLAPNVTMEDAVHPSRKSLFVRGSRNVYPLSRDLLTFS